MPGPQLAGNRWCTTDIMPLHHVVAAGVTDRDQIRRETGMNSVDSVGEWTSQWAAMVVLVSLGQSPAGSRGNAGIGMAGRDRADAQFGAVHMRLLGGVAAKFCDQHPESLS